MDNEIVEIQNKLREQQNQTNCQTDNYPQESSVKEIVKSEIKSQYEKNRNELVSSVNFQKLAKEITERTAKAELSKDMIAILNQEQKNELSEYLLQCEKQRLDYKKKKERKLIVEEVRAEVFNRKTDALKKKYGYLYEKDANGNLKGFVPNRTYNQYRAFCNWWDNTTDGFKKIVKGTLKVIFWVGVASLIVLVGYRAFEWIASNTQNLPKING